MFILPLCVQNYLPKSRTQYRQNDFPNFPIDDQGAGFCAWSAVYLSIT